MAKTPDRSDTPHTDDKPALVDTKNETVVDPAKNSDTPRTDGEPALVDIPKARDYDPEKNSDSPRTDPEPALVEHYGRDLNGPTPNEVYAKSGKKE